MPAITVSYTTIADAAVDPDSPVTTALATSWRDNPEFVKQWLGEAYLAGAVQNHNHDGVNSAPVEVGIPGLVHAMGVKLASGQSTAIDLSAAPFTSYRTKLIVLHRVLCGNNDAMYMRFSNSSGSGPFDSGNDYAPDGSFYSLIPVGIDSIAAGMILLPDHYATGQHPFFSIMSASDRFSAPGAPVQIIANGFRSGLWSANDPINGVQIFAASGVFVSDPEWTVYGLQN